MITKNIYFLIVAMLFMAVSVQAAPFVIDGEYAFDTEGGTYYNVDPAATWIKLNFQPDPNTINDDVIADANMIPPDGWPGDWYVDVGGSYTDDPCDFTGYPDYAGAYGIYQHGVSAGNKIPPQENFVDSYVYGEGEEEFAQCTYIKLQEQNEWTWDIPNGTYLVRLAVGDRNDPKPCYDFTVEGVLVEDNDASFDIFEVEVVITDANLSLDNLQVNGTNDPRLCYIQITEGPYTEHFREVVPTDEGKSKVIYEFPDGLTITDTADITVIGENALQIVAAAGDIVVNGAIDLSGGNSGDDGGPAGPGGWAGSDENAGNGSGPGGGVHDNNGGGGGAFGGDGGRGGSDSSGSSAYGNEELVSLYGGSGGAGGDNDGGGGGGGAIALKALTGNITIGATGSIIANGGVDRGVRAYNTDTGSGDWTEWNRTGGPVDIYGPYDEHVFPEPPFNHSGSDYDEKGGGGGAGGAILLEAGAGSVVLDGTLQAKGGKGADNTDDWDSEDSDAGGGGGGGRIAIYTATGDTGISGATKGLHDVSGGLNGSALDPDGEYLEPYGLPLADTDAKPGDDGTYYVGTGFVPLLAPDNPVPDDGSTTSVSSLSWDAVPGAVGYNVYFSKLLADVEPGTSAAPDYVTDPEKALGALTENTQYYWRVDSVGDTATTEGEVWTVMNANIILVARINFQPEGYATPDGYLADEGLAYGDRGNGQEYGWVGGDNLETRDRGGSDPRYATINHMYKVDPPAIWEIALAGGKYSIDLFCGDNDHTNQINDILAEGVLAFIDTDGEDNHDEWLGVAVTVSDGKLTLTPDPTASAATNEADSNAKIQFIHISAGSVPFPTVIAPVDGADIYSPTIEWTPSSDPNYDEYDVWYGDHPDTMTSLGTATFGLDPNTMDIPGTLSINTPYYCKVVARDTDGPLDDLTGFVWEFTTRGPSCLEPPEGDVSGPDGVPDCLVDDYDLVAMVKDWLNCTDTMTNCN